MILIQSRKFWMATAIIFVLGAVLFLYLSYGAKLNTNSEHPDWQKSVGIGGEVFYPADFSTIYIHPQDWPPQVTVMDRPFDCAEGGAESSVYGRTEMHKVNGEDYCVVKKSEGAAGSIYSQYGYAFIRDNSLVVLTFSTRQSACGNYDESERAVCEKEINEFNLDSLVDEIAQTFRVR